MQTHLEKALGDEVVVNLSGPRLIIASNRGPVEYATDDTGGLERRRADGGLVTALACVAKSRPVAWVAGACSAADRAAATSGAVAEWGEDRRLRLVASSAEAYELFYGTICNPLLWFLQHSMWDQLQRTDPGSELLHAWEKGYLPVNEAFGRAVAEELDASGGEGQVMLHDYHLYVAPRVIRQRAPRAVLQHFVHIPWPHPRQWHVLPRTIVEAICEGLLANDSVVFQTQESVQNFLLTCQAFLPDARLAGDLRTIAHAGRRTRVWANPISVDVSDLRARVSSPRADAYREKLSRETGERTIVRVDRLDPSKNVAAGFRAFESLLDRHPEWEGRVKFLACLVPSRNSILEYRAYTEETFGVVEAINKRHGRPGWKPITVFHEHDRLQALVAMSLYDVLLVNPLRDGMNLVSKEGPVVNERHGALVLSVTAGSFAELRDGALAVQPDDIGGTADALHTALSLTEAERRERAMLVKRAVLRHDLDDWLLRQLDDLNAIERGERLARTSWALPGDGERRWIGRTASARR